MESRLGSLRSARDAGSLLLVAALLFELVGCDIAFMPTASDGGAMLPSSSNPRDAGAGSASGDSFDQAIAIALDANGRATVSALLSSTDDLDLFDLGAVTTGDRIVIDVAAQRDALDAVAAVFDDETRLVAENDDRDFERQQLDPRLDFVARHDGDPYFLGVASVSGAGAYVVTVQITAGDEAPAPMAQTLLLDFDGGSIVLQDGSVKTVDAFDAEMIHPSLAGSTDALKDAIIATVMANFAAFDVVVLNTDDDVPPADGNFSRVLFGGFSSSRFGEAQGVDPYNGDKSDEAIVYTGAFGPGTFLPFPNVDVLGLALGNVASHEAGHLLGLNHVADPRFLMDTRGVADTLLEKQVFGLAPLDVSIFPTGLQDSTLLLRETVGLATD